MYDALKRSGNNEFAENVYNASPNELSRDVLVRPQPLLRHYSPSPTLEIQKKPTTTTTIETTRTRTPTMESDSQFSVSPVPSEDMTDQLSFSPNNNNNNNWGNNDEIATSSDISSSEFTMSTTQQTQPNDMIMRDSDLMNRTLSSPEQDDSDIMMSEEKRSEYEESLLSSSEYDGTMNSTNQERWSTTATYATNTPDEEKFHDEEPELMRPRSPVSPVSIRSDRLDTTKDGEVTDDGGSRPTSFRRESSFENSIVTLCDVSATVTPHTCSPTLIGGNEDIDENVVEVKSVLDEQPPEIDFSALGDPEEIDAPTMDEKAEERTMSPYEISIQQQKRELEEQWELEYSKENKIPNYTSNQLVNEDDLVEQKQQQVESGIDFGSLDSLPSSPSNGTEDIGRDAHVVNPSLEAQDDEFPAVVDAQFDHIENENPAIPDMRQREDVQELETVDNDDKIVLIQAAADPTQSSSAGQHISRTEDVDRYDVGDSEFPDEQQDIQHDSQPEIDFSVLGEPDDSQMPQSASATPDERVISPYELSMQQRQLELDSEWERENAPRMFSPGSRTPVEEEDQYEEKKSNPDLNLKYQVEEDVPGDVPSDAEVVAKENAGLPQEDSIIVPEVVFEDEATPYYELSSSEKVKIGEKLVEGPVYVPQPQSEPASFGDDDDDDDDDDDGDSRPLSYADNGEVLPEPVFIPQTESEPSLFDEHHNGNSKNANHLSGNDDEGLPEPVSIPQTEAEPSSCFDESKADNVDVLSEPSTVIQQYTEDEPVSIESTLALKPVVAIGGSSSIEYNHEENHNDGEIVETENGFTKIVSNTTVSEKVLSMTKTEVREVSPEELQQLIALQQQQHNGDNGTMTTTISTTTVVQREIVGDKPGETEELLTTTIVQSDHGDQKTITTTTQNAEVC